MHIDQDHVGLYDMICIDIMCIYVQYVYVYIYTCIRLTYSIPILQMVFWVEILRRVQLSPEVIPNDPKLGSSKGITSRPTQPTNSSGHGWENDATPRANPNQLNYIGRFNICKTSSAEQSASHLTSW